MDPFSKPFVCIRVWAELMFPVGANECLSRQSANTRRVAGVVVVAKLRVIVVFKLHLDVMTFNVAIVSS